MGNYVIGVGNYVIVSPSQLGNYKIADTQRMNSGAARYELALILIKAAPAAPLARRQRRAPP
jgi:hypothetical protein